MQRRPRPPAADGAPAAVRATAHASGTLSPTSSSAALLDLLPTSATAGGGWRLDLDPGEEERLRSWVALFVADGAQRADIEVAGLRGRVWLRLHHRRPDARTPRVAGTRRDRPVLVVAGPAPSRPATADDTDDRSTVVGRLTVALLRLRRSPGTVAVAVAHVLSPRGAVGPAVGPDLVERLRLTARDTDVVGRVGPDVVALVAEVLEDGGELAVGRRLTTFLQRQVPDDGGHGVHTVTAAVRDPDADPESVLHHLVEQARSPAGGHGLTVLSEWTAATTVPPEAADAGIRAALASGRFVLGTRAVTALRPADDDPGPVLVEVATDDDGRLSPVRVAAPGLAAALDGWLLEQVGQLVPDGAVAVRLQPGGVLSTRLGEQVAALGARRPGLALVLQVPEPRLAEAVGAGRAVLATLADSGAQLGVASWTGQLPPTTLVSHRVGLVELAADVPARTLTPVGSASVAALCAALRVATGSSAIVVADRPSSPEVAQSLAECGVRHTAPVDPVPTDDQPADPRPVPAGAP